MSLLDFSPRIPLGTFSILLLTCLFPCNDTWYITDCIKFGLVRLLVVLRYTQQYFSYISDGTYIGRRPKIDLRYSSQSHRHQRCQNKQFLDYCICGILHGDDILGNTKDRSDHRVWFKRGRRRTGFPPSRKSYQKKSVSIGNPPLILPAFATPNKRKWRPAFILNLSFQAGSLSKMHAYRHIPAQTRLEITLSGTSYILHL